MDAVITTIILTYNEELHMRRCLDNVVQFSKKVFVIDCQSTDKTCEICSQYGNVEVVQHKWPGNQAAQFQWALDTLQIDTEWVLRLDADEYLGDELIAEIKETLPKLDSNVTGCYLLRDVIFLGRRLKHGKLHPISLLRLWRNGSVYMEQRWMDEHCILKYGESITLKNYFFDENLNGLTSWIQKHNNYSNREILVEKGTEYGLLNEDEGLEGRNRQKSRYYRMPKYLRAFMYFFTRYICLGGFLDGKPGLIWATLQAYWYRFLIDAKLEEMDYVLGKNPSKEEVREYFRKHFKINI